MKKFVYIIAALGLLASPLLARKGLKVEKSNVTQEEKTIERSLKAPSIGKQWLSHLVETAKQGVYNDQLEQLDRLYDNGIKENQFKDMMLYSEQGSGLRNLFSNVQQTKEKYLEKLKELEDTKNQELLQVAGKNPDLQIANIINAYLDHHNLKLQDIQTSQNVEEVLLGIKSLPTEEQDILSQTRSIYNEYQIKKSLLTAHLFMQGKISKETFYSIDQILQMEKSEKLKDLCKKYPKATLAKLLQEKTQAFEAYFPYKYEENYLITLSKVKEEKFQNKTEKNVSKIMSSYQAKKQKLFSAK